MSQEPAQFAAVIGHADDADLLELSIAHHLEIGVDRIFVSLNTRDGASEKVARDFEAAFPGRVRAARLETFAGDPFQHFTAALAVVRAWAQPDWMLFVDTDEFWIPASGRIAGTAGLDRYDALWVPRYNAPPVRDEDGSVRAARTIDPATIDVVDGPLIADSAELNAAPGLRWIMTKDHPKLLVRAEGVSEVGRGAHTVSPAPAPDRIATASDLLIVHLPITTRERFRRKLAAIRERLQTYGDRFGPGQAWHWRRWMELDAAGEVDAEYERQLIEARDLPRLRERGELRTPAAIFARERITCS